MQRFTGVFERQLDVKGRLALPATFRAHLGTICYLTLGSDSSIEVFTTQQFDDEADRMQELERSGAISRDRLRAFSVRAQTAEPDAQGRIYLDERLRQHARLAVKGPAMVMGLLDRIEICSVDRYGRSMATGELQYSESQS